MAWSLLIKNGTVIDGSGAARCKADVAIAGDRIVAVAPELAGNAERIIDATSAGGRAGLHRHPFALRFLLRAMPVGGIENPPGRDHRGGRDVQLLACPLHAREPPSGRAWRRIRSAPRSRCAGAPSIEYLDALEQAHPSINVVHFVGHGPIRYAAMGAENRAPSAGRARQHERPAGGSHGCRSIRVVLGAGLCAERLRQDRGADRAMPIDGARAAASISPTCAARARRLLDSVAEAVRICRGRRRSAADRASQIARARELAAVRPGAGADRRGARAQARRHRRRLSLCGEQHLPERAAARLGA